MKKLRVFLIVSFLFYSVSSDAQNTAFPNASKQPLWTTRYKLDLGGFGYENLQIQKDTQICGRNYGILYIPINGIPPFLLGFVRTEGKKSWIFQRNATCSSKEYLLYDFGLKKGDTTYCGYFSTPLAGMPDTIKFWVNSIDSVFNQGRYIRRLRMNFISNNPCGTVSNPCDTLKMDWLDGIGSTSNPFYSYGCVDCDQEPTLMCLQTNSGLQYRDSMAISCPTATTATHNIENESITIAPNPVSSVLVLKNCSECIGSQVLIMDLMGRVVKKDKLDLAQEINVSDLPNGLYFLKLVKDGHPRIAKFEIMN